MTLILSASKFRNAFPRNQTLSIYGSLSAREPCRSPCRRVNTMSCHGDAASLCLRNFPMQRSLTFDWLNICSADWILSQSANIVDRNNSQAWVTGSKAESQQQPKLGAQSPVFLSFTFSLWINVSYVTPLWLHILSSTVKSTSINFGVVTMIDI